MELELIKKLNEISCNDKDMCKLFKDNLNITLKEVDDFVLHYDPDYKEFDIGIIMNNGYDGYDIDYRGLNDFDFLNIENNKIELER